MGAYYWIHSMGAYFVKTIHVILTEVTTTSTTTTTSTSTTTTSTTSTTTTRETTTEVKETSIDNLPVEVVSLIGSGLFARDRACFRAVCKTWRYSIPPAPRSVQLDEMVKFPHMYMGCEGSSCRFYHPILNTTYTLTIPNNSKIRYSKDGWLLMSQANHIFFFNPITHKRIDLPDLPNTYSFKGVCFSSAPTSLDCIVFGITCTNSNSTHFSYTRRGQYIWNRITGFNNIEFLSSHTNPVFHQGVFYCLGRKGNLATFDPKHSAWTVLIKPVKPCKEIRRNYLVDCDGDLISVFEGHVGNAIEIFKMDYSVMAWRKAKSLGDKMLFVSTTGYATSQVVGMENMIYFPRFYGKSSVFYSLITSKFHTLGSGYNCDDFYGTTIRTDSTWFEPSFDTCPKDFRWWSV